MIALKEARKRANRYARKEHCRITDRSFEIDGEWAFSTIDLSGEIVDANLPTILVDKASGAIRTVRLPSAEGFRIMHGKTLVNED